MTTDGFGNTYRLSDWGDTHSDCLEGLIEGCPQGITIDWQLLQNDMARRAPSNDANSTQRREPDNVEFLSGIDGNGITTGEPLRFRIPNKDVVVDESKRHLIRPSHASFTYYKKYGYADNELCGRASARQTACRVVAGAIAKMYLQTQGISTTSEVVFQSIPKRAGDSTGAIVRGIINGLPAGLGEPVYDKFSARLAYAMMSINAAKGFEIGEGFNAATFCGSEYNDLMNADFSFRSNHDGGVQAGITNGQEVVFRVAFKPIPSVRFDQETIDFDGKPAILHGSNRNDLCVAPRVLPVVEAMAAIVVMDFLMING